jgi:hypothetical protein
MYLFDMPIDYNNLRNNLDIIDCRIPTRNINYNLLQPHHNDHNMDLAVLHSHHTTTTDHVITIEEQLKMVK